jgi:hypothetical protein
MDWTLDTCIDITPAALAAVTARNRRTAQRGYKPTASGRRAVRDLQQARDAIEALPFVVGPPRDYVSPVDALEERRPLLEAPETRTCAGCGDSFLNFEEGDRYCADCLHEQEEFAALQRLATVDAEARRFLDSCEGNVDITTNRPSCTPDHR